MLLMHRSLLPPLGLQLFQEEEINSVNQRLVIFQFISRPDSLESLWFFEWGQSDISVMVFLSSTLQNSQTSL